MSLVLTQAFTNPEEPDEERERIEELLQPILKTSDILVFPTENDEFRGVAYEKNNEVYQLKVGYLDVPDSLLELTQLIHDSFIEDGLSLMLDDDMAQGDTLLIDKNTGQHYLFRISRVTMEPGVLAEEINKTVLQIFDSNGYQINNGIVLKRNSDEITSRREYDILRNIRLDNDLQSIGVTAPVILGQRGTYLCMENLPFRSVENYLKCRDVSDEKKRSVLQRIVKATQIIENKLPQYSSDFDQSDVLGGEKVECFGPQHAVAVQYLRDNNMYDRWLSDSVLTNWLYDEEHDKIYKIDENAQIRGSKFSCLARIADFKHNVSMDERERLLELMLEPGDNQQLS
jgi:hypothetical protein